MCSGLPPSFPLSYQCLCPSAGLCGSPDLLSGAPSVLGVLAHARYVVLGTAGLLSSFQDGAGCLAALLRMRERPTLLAADLKAQQ